MLIQSRRGQRGRLTGRSRIVGPIVGALAVTLLAGCAPREPTAPSAPASTSRATPSAAMAPPCPASAPTAAAPTWWTDRVFYEVFVRSFADGNADGIGDLAGLTARLDYLNDGDPATTTDLGVTGIWLMPVFEATSYHGYDVVDYETIEPDYGDAAAFRAFLEAAHRRGIKVIVDLVLNHTAANNPWFQDALAGGARRDWYLWRDTDPGWPAVAGGNPWRESPSGWYYGAFSAQMPDLNLVNPEVTAELERIATAWLDAGVDGFRLDAAKFLIETGPGAQVNTPETRAWLASFRASLQAAHPEALLLGEVWEPRAVTTGYIADGSLDLVFDFGIGPTILRATRLGDATSLVAGMKEVGGRYPTGAVATFLTNHDQPRVMTELRGDIAGAELAAAALLTGPGVPVVYYGEELGLLGTKPDALIRTPFPWTSEGSGFGFTTGTPWEPFGPNPELVNVERQAADAASLLSAYRRLIQLRAAQPELAAGTVMRLKASRDDVAATLRQSTAGAAIVVQNLGPEVARNVALTLDEGPLCGNPGAVIAYSTGGDVGRTVAPPKINSAGGLDSYVALPSIPARSTVVIDLSP